MNKKIIFIIVFIWLLLLNSVNIYNYFIFGEINKYYNEWTYDLSYKNYSQRNDVVSVFNSANSLYKLKKYDEALKLYLALENKNFNYKDILLYNIWNTYYRIWENTSQDTKKYANYQSALDYYKKSMDIKSSKQTQDNYDFVYAKMNKLKDDKTDSFSKDESEQLQLEQQNASWSTSNDENNSQSANSWEKQKTTTNSNNSTLNSSKTWTWLSSNKDTSTWTSLTNSWTSQDTSWLSDDLKSRILEEQQKLMQEQQKYQNELQNIDDSDSVSNIFNNFLNENTSLNSDTQASTWWVNEKDW